MRSACCRALKNHENGENHAHAQVFLDEERDVTQELSITRWLRVLVDSGINHHSWMQHQLTRLKDVWKEGVDSRWTFIKTNSLQALLAARLLIHIYQRLMTA